VINRVPSIIRKNHSAFSRKEKGGGRGKNSWQKGEKSPKKKQGKRGTYSKKQAPPFTSMRERELVGDLLSLKKLKGKEQPASFYKVSIGITLRTVGKKEKGGRRRTVAHPHKKEEPGSKRDGILN